MIHFCGVLLIAAIVCAPWQSLEPAAGSLAVCGVAGIVYVIVNIGRTRQQSEYRPVLEDWIWHGVFPMVAYAALLTGALALVRHTTGSLFDVGAASLLLLLTGIHNAWDAVTFIAFKENRSD